MKLLLHICCANCSLYPLRHFTAKGIDIKGLWFNPNIEPKDEYQKRLSTLEVLSNLWGLDIEYDLRYGIDRSYRKAQNQAESRCPVCYLIRLEKTAQTAKKMGLDGFTTTLLVSPYQKFGLIVDIARQMEKRHKIPFYFEDLRAGWKEGVRISKELGLYRQKYCGCLSSKAERGL